MQLDSIKKKLVQEIERQRGSGWAMAVTLEQAKAKLTAADFKEVCDSIGLNVISATSYANTAKDESVRWAVDNNIIKSSIGTLVKMRGIPLDAMKKAAAAGMFKGLRQNNAMEIKRSIIGLPTNQVVRKSNILSDEWPEGWRRFANKLINAGLSSRAAVDAIANEASKRLASGQSTPAQIRAELVQVLLANTANTGANGTNDTISATDQGLTLTFDQRWIDGIKMKLVLEIQK